MWTQEEPTEDGCYWGYDLEDKRVVLWELIDGDTWMVMGSDYAKPSSGQYWWSVKMEAPLPPIEEQKRRLRAEGRLLGDVTQGK